MQRRTFLALVAAAATGAVLPAVRGGELQHWRTNPHSKGGFGQFIWTGKNPRRVCYKGHLPQKAWEDFKNGVNFEDRSDWRAVVCEIDDLPWLLDRLPKENFVRVS